MATTSPHLAQWTLPWLAPQVLNGRTRSPADLMGEVPVHKYGPGITAGAIFKTNTKAMTALVRLFLFLLGDPLDGASFQHV
jgi:hypothetical protein